MGYRSKSIRSNNPLLVTASALNRAIDPKEPSRITVIRILSDALYSLQESQLKLDHAKAHTSAYVANKSIRPLSRAHLEHVTQLRSDHEKGARALFTATVEVLIKLPTRGGTLRRRAIDLLEVAGHAGGTAVVMQGVNIMREHLTSLKRLSWTDSEMTNFEVICTVMNLATISSCSMAGRDVARESIHFLLSPRIRQKCRRNDLGLAISTIVQSFPAHVPPEDRLIDNMLELVLSPSSIKQSQTCFGCGLLTALLVPMLVSRGPDAADKVVNFCAESLQSIPTVTERGIWILALARAAITARRSTTFQMKRYGTPDATSKFPRGNSGANANPNSDAGAAWISNEIFEESLVQVSKVSGLEDGRVDAVIAMATVIRMWAAALPESRSIIIPRAFSKLLTTASTVASLSVWVDGIWLGLLRDLKPSNSVDVLESILSTLLESDIRLGAVLHLCGTILLQHGRQCLRESGLTREYSDTTESLIKHAQESLHSNFFTVRLAGVRLITALIKALPRTCAMFLTVGLQNLRISDLSLAMKPSATADVQSSSKVLRYAEEEISPILGHSSALVVLFREIVNDTSRVPLELRRPCIADAFALLQPHHASLESGGHGIIVESLRRRVGWGLITAMAGATDELELDQDKISALLPFWKRELGSSNIREHPSSANENHSSTNQFSQTNGATTNDDITLDEFLALSSTRAAALCALYAILSTAPSENLKQCARSVVGHSAVKLVGYLTMFSGSATSNSVITGLGLNSIPGDPTHPTDSGPVRKRSVSQLLKYLTCEAFQTIQCISIIPPHGELAEACFYLSLFLGEEAQKSLGETSSSTNLTVPSPQLGTSDRMPLEATMTNHRYTLQKYNIFTEASLSNPCDFRRLSDTAFDSEISQEVELNLTEMSWIFGRTGVDGLHAEKALVMSAKGIAAIVCQDLAGAGSLIESLPKAKLTPPLCGAVGLQMIKQLSRSDLAEINKALAVLQLLARRSLAITGACQKSISSQNRNGKLFTPPKPGFFCTFESLETPGSILRGMTQSGGWLGWTRMFLQEGHIYRLPFQNFHSSAHGLVYATRAIATAVHRELSITGGAKLWNGLMRQVMSNVKENRDGATATQLIIVVSSIATLGSLLEAKPEFSMASINSAATKKGDKMPNDPKTVEQMSNEAINLLTSLIESKNAEVQAAAALALSSRSQDVAASSERILSTLLRAWAQDRGDQSRIGHFGSSIDETDIWVSSFIHSWKGMGVNDGILSPQFFTPNSHGYGYASIAFSIGAAAVLSSCRLYQWHVSEASYASVKEMASELVQWMGRNGEKARAAGLYGMSSIWAAKTDAARSHMSFGDFQNTWGVSDTRKSSSLVAQNVPVLPVDSFSLKEPSRMASPLGPFLDEVLYDALTPVEPYSASSELQVAATGAVLEMIRGAGAAKTCENLPRLPESLFGAAEWGILHAGKLLHLLAHHNASKRPRYWFGLCRSICLRHERLNYGNMKATWDVPLSTICLSAKVATIAVELSAKHCTCYLRDESYSQGKQVKHTCSMGFIPTMLDFAKESISGKNVDIVTVIEGCNLLDSVICGMSEALNSSFKEIPENSITYESFQTHLGLTESFLNDDRPQSAVARAAKSVAEIMILLIKNSRALEEGEVNDRLRRIEEKVNSLLNSSGQNKFQYIDQSVEVGKGVFLYVTSQFARVLSALRAHQLLDGRTGCVSMGAANRLLTSYCMDFASNLIESGSTTFYVEKELSGSSSLLTHRPRSPLHEHIPFIILGKISCCSDLKENETSCERSNSSEELRLVTEVDEERFAVVLLVWLFQHIHGDADLLAGTGFWAQVQDSLHTYISVKQDDDHNTLQKEVIVSFAQRNMTAFLQFIETLPVTLTVKPEIFSLIIEILVSFMVDFADEDFSACYEDEIRSVRRIIVAFKTVINNETYQYVPESLQIHMLDALFEVFCTKNKAIISVLSSPSFEPELKELLPMCISRHGERTNLRDGIIAKLDVMYWNGLEMRSPSHIKLTILLMLILNEVLDKQLEENLKRIILTEGIILTDDDSATSCLALGLEYEMVITLLKGLITDAANGGTPSKQAELIAMANGLSDLGTSTIAYSVPAALRLSITAILAEGEDCYWINRVGMVLYSIFLPVLMKKLPSDTQERKDHKSSGLECRKFFVDMIDKESFSLDSFVSFLQEEERAEGTKFLHTLEIDSQSPESKLT